MQTSQIIERYRNTRFILTFSAGKDSVASWLYLRELGLNVRCVFADTLWEDKSTYEYIDLLRREHGLDCVRVCAKVRDLWKREPPERIPREDWDKELGMRTLIEIKKRAPSLMRRFCTTILKLEPVQKYVAGIGDCVLASGVRAEESAKRAEQSPWCFDDFMERWRWLPIHNWKVEQVFEIHRKHGIPIHPLYMKGCKRVGCFPCINAGKDDLAAVARSPEARERLYQIEKIKNDSGNSITFFSPGKTSQRYHSRIDPSSGKWINTAEDVFRWALKEMPDWKEGELFRGQEVPLDFGDDIEAMACSSPYGLCE